MLRQGIFLLFLVTFSSLSFAVEAFKSIKFPSGSSLELPVSIQQGPNGQIWLTSESSVSLFTSDQFVQYKQFDLPSDIQSTLVLNNGFLIAAQGLVFHAAKDQINAYEPVWIELNLDVQAITASLEEVLLVSEFSVYKVNKTDLLSQIPTQIFTSSSAIIEVKVSKQQVFAITENRLIVHSLNTGQTSSFTLPQTLTQLAVTQSQIYAVTADSELIELSVLGQQLETQQLLSGVDSIISASDQIYVRQGKTLSLLNDSSKQITLPYVTNQLYFDQGNNLWLLSPYDVQVKWQQSIELQPYVGEELGRFDAYSPSVAMQNNRLYIRQNNQSNRTFKTTLTGVSGVKKIVTTDNEIWLLTEQKLIALNRQSFTQKHAFNVTNNDLVFKLSKNKLLLVTNRALLELSNNGASSTLKTCLNSCLPDYEIAQSVSIDGQALLATNSGLHTFDFASLNFSSDRLDKLNEQSAVLSITQAGNNKVWLLYPHKVALFDLETLTSEIYYSENNRLFSLTKLTSGETALFSQKGWFKVKLVHPVNAHQEGQINLHKVTNDDSLIQFVEPESILQLTDTEQELRLAFNLTKQHSDQTVYFRLKYTDEENWSEASQLMQSITLKNLRQGENSLLMQARLEGKNWSASRTFNYQMPYKYLQTKWVLFYAFLTFLAVASVYAVERFKRFKIAFDTLKKETFINSLLESTKDGVWVANKDREIESVNQAFVEISGFNGEEVVGKPFHLNGHQGRNRELESLIWQEVVKSGFWSGEVWSKKKTEEDISIDMSVTSVETCDKVSNKKHVRYVGVFSDVTDRKNSERALRDLATRDPLTELANRTLYIELVEQAIATANPANPSFGLMFIDLDNFSKVNANLGPLQGDELIKQVADRLRGSFDRGVSLARLTADEFALLIPNHLLVGEPAFYIRRLAGMIKRKLQPSFELANTQVNISASMGVAFYPQHGNRSETLMRCADTALKKVKDSGKNNFIIYAKELDSDDSEVLSLESELIRALDKDEFKVYYQPKYLVQQHVVSGYEALVRWDNPDRGIVSPDMFIGLAEQNGLIRQLDSAVLKKVCEQIVYWGKQGVKFGSVAVNISALNFQQKEFCQTIQEILKQHKVNPEHIELEITESAMMSDPEQTLANLNELRSLGFTIALDDFGTGHSSLGHLKYFPIDRIKIDRSFVKDIETCDEDKNITSVIIQLAKHLNMKVIAEGVENQSQAYILHILGCNEIQGYYISKPLPADEVMPFLQDRMAGLPDIALD